MGLALLFACLLTCPAEADRFSSRRGLREAHAIEGRESGRGAGRRGAVQRFSGSTCFGVGRRGVIKVVPWACRAVSFLAQQRPPDCRFRTQRLYNGSLVLSESYQCSGVTGCYVLYTVFSAYAATFPKHLRLLLLLPLSPRQNKDSTGDEKLTAAQLGDYYKKLAEDFPIVSIEDGFDQARK